MKKILSLFICLALLVQRRFAGAGQMTRDYKWGVMGTAAAGVLSAGVVLSLTLPDFVRPATPGHNAVTYGNYMAYMAVVAAFSLGVAANAVAACRACA